MKPFNVVFLLVCCVPVISSTCHAQASVYGTVGISDYGYSNSQNNFTVNRVRPGLTVGGYYNFPIESRLTAGIDLRGSFTPAATGGDKFLLAARFGFVPHVIRFEPYLQLGAGVFQAKIPGDSTVTSGGIDLALGLDFRINSSFDYRVLEVESGAGGGTSSAGSASITTGLVYHFPHKI